MESKRIGTVICCFLAIAGLSACSSVRLYDSVRDQQGIAAKKAWSEVDLAATIAGERSNLNKLLVVELETQDQLAKAIRERELRNMVHSPSLKTGLAEPLDARLGTLMTAPALPAAAIGKLQAATIVSNATAAVLLQATGLAAPSCASVANGAIPKNLQDWMDRTASVVARSAVDNTLTVIRTECADAPAEAAVYAALGGEIGSAWAQYQRDADALTLRRTDVKGLRDTYASALRDYDKAAASASANPQAVAQVAHAADAVKAALDALERANNPFASRLVAEEHIKALADLAEAITQAAPGDPPPAGASKAARALIVLPNLLDDARTSLAQAKLPLAAPLIIRRNFERLNLEAAKRDIAAQEAIVALSHDLVLALYAQAEQLVFARDTLRQANVAPLLKERFSAALAKGGPAERNALYRAAALYLDAVDRYDARRYRLEYMRIAAYHERALAYAEVNAKQWESLIGTTVDQVAGYSASGIKPEQIAQALNTLGIFYIGSGVQK